MPMHEQLYAAANAIVYEDRVALHPNGPYCGIIAQHFQSILALGSALSNALLKMT